LQVYTLELFQQKYTNIKPMSPFKTGMKIRFHIYAGSWMNILTTGHTENDGT